MKKREEKGKLSRYGKLVCDFANGDTTDKVLTDYFKNLQSAFDFSKDFPQKALLRYPTNKIIISSLSKEEQYLFELLIKRNEIVDDYRANSSCEYNPTNQIFTIWERNLYPAGADDEGNKPVHKSRLIPLAEMGEYLIKSDDTEISKHSKKILAATCYLIKKNRQTTSRFAEIEKIAIDHYARISSELQYQISDTKERLKSILLQIIESDNPYESEEFRSFLSQYNKIPTINCIISDAGKLVDICPFTEDRFLAERPIWNEVEYPDDTLIWMTRELFGPPISYCLIEFLKNPEYSRKKRIARCGDCLNVFAKTKLNDKQIYCSDCSKKTHVEPEKQKKRTQNSRMAARNKKRNELYESQYERLLDSGHSTKDAGKIAKAYVIELLGEKEKLHVIE